MSSSVNGFLVSGSGHLTCTSTGSFSCVSASTEGLSGGSGGVVGVEGIGSGGGSESSVVVNLPIFEVDGVIDASVDASTNWQYVRYNSDVNKRLYTSAFTPTYAYDASTEQLTITSPGGSQYSEFSDGVLLKVLSYETSGGLSERKVHHKGVAQSANIPGYWDGTYEVDDPVYQYDFYNNPNDSNNPYSEPYGTHTGFTHFPDASPSIAAIRDPITMHVMVTNLESQGLPASANGVYRIYTSNSGPVLFVRSTGAITGGDAVGETVDINSRYNYDIASPTFLQNYAFRVRYGRTFGNKTFIYDATSQDFVEQT